MGQDKTERGTASETWSYTKSRLYAECPRAFYFRRETRDGDKEGTDEIASDAVNLGAVLGIAVHRAIASEMDKWEDGEQPDLRDAQKSAERWIEGVWSQPGKRIIEVANGRSVDAGIKKRIAGGAKSHLKTFFQTIWPRLRSRDHILHETLKVFSLEEWSAVVKVDLCTRDESGIVYVTDWKTGSLPVLGDNSFQLNTYALWASEELEVDPGGIEVQLASTKTGQILSRQPNESDLDEARETIVDESKQWAELEGRNDFPAVPGWDKCLGCPFLAICPEGKEVVE